jgi:hypothetical protein
VDCEDVNWILLHEDIDQWQACLLADKPFGYHKLLVISCLAGKQAAQEGLSYME